MTEGVQAGWSCLGGAARRFHYFESPDYGTRALCGRWMIGRPHSLEADNGPSPSDCPVCRIKLTNTIERTA